MELTDLIIPTDNNLEIDMCKPTHIFYTRNGIANRIYHTVYNSAKFYQWNYHLYLAEQKKGNIDIVYVGNNPVISINGIPNAKIIELEEVDI